MKHTLIIFFCFLLFKPAFCEKINICIFNDQKISVFTFSPKSGSYNLSVDSNIILKINKGDVLKVSRVKDSLSLRLNDKKSGTFRYFLISGTSNVNYFKITPLIPAIPARVYDDDLYAFIYEGKFQIINKVEMDNYIAGVVQSEGGPKPGIEYYKTQAIICRTYALQNINKHIGDMYNLCDNTHCQAYHGKCTSNVDIITASKLTTGLVIVDTTLSLIIATFHSNCGGETAFSEDVWTKPKSYLKSVTDTCCLKTNNAQWKKTIPLYQWKKYLMQNGFKFNDSLHNPGYFSFIQAHRTMYYKLNRDSIALTKVRTDLNLRSTFFSIEQNGNDIIFKGKGYGHGVGLCQEGAMKMAANGFKYMDIIKYYYKNIYIVSTRALQFKN